MASIYLIQNHILKVDSFKTRHGSTNKQLILAQGEINFDMMEY